MRILSLGFPLPGAPIDNHTFAGAPTFFDYDALVVDPRALSQLIEEVIDGSAAYVTRSGERVTNASDSPDTLALAQLLRNRHEETNRLRAPGGVVGFFVFPHAIPQPGPGFP